MQLNAIDAANRAVVMIRYRLLLEVHMRVVPPPPLVQAPPRFYGVTSTWCLEKAKNDGVTTKTTVSPAPGAWTRWCLDTGEGG